MKKIKTLMEYVNLPTGDKEIIEVPVANAEHVAGHGEDCERASDASAR